MGLNRPKVQCKENSFETIKWNLYALFCQQSLMWDFFNKSHYFERRNAVKTKLEKQNIAERTKQE